MKKEHVPMVVAAAGFVVLSFGVFMAWYGFQWVLDKNIAAEISMDEDTENYKMWLVQPFPLKFRVYIFEITNPEQVQNGALPLIHEKGPYVYNEYRRKEKVFYDKQADYIKYVLKKMYIFNAEESGCRSENDEVIILNSALIGIANVVSTTTPEVIPLVNEAVPFMFPKIKNIFTKVKVRDLLFDGLLVNCTSPDIDLVCKGVRTTKPDILRHHDNKKDFLFSLFHHLNETDEGPYVMGIGARNTSRGNIYAYKNDTDTMKVWKTPECNAIKGTDSTIYHPNGLTNRTFIFSSDLCRSVYIDMENETAPLGIRAYKYVNNKQSLELSEENKCYCVDEVNEDFETETRCTPEGTMNLMPCMKSPTIYSNPHFYLGDKKLLEYARGLVPDKERHQNFIEIEPVTGTPVRGAKRAQFNLNIRKIEGFDLLENITEGIFPLVWIEEFAELTPPYADKLRMLYTAMSAVGIFKWVIILSGIMLLIVALLLHLRRAKMLCFNDSKVDDDSDSTRWADENNKGISVFENNFNEDFSPKLYPQVMHKTMNVDVTKNKYENKFLM